MSRTPVHIAVLAIPLLAACVPTTSPAPGAPANPSHASHTFAAVPPAMPSAAPLAYIPTPPAPPPEFLHLPPAAISAASPAVRGAALDAPPFASRLPGGLFNPMPGGFVAGYPADTGLDIAGFHQPVYALAAGTLVYSEAGHTRWAKDDAAVLLRLHVPIVVARWTSSGEARSHRVTHVWYAHLSQLRFQQSSDAPRPIQVQGGELLAISGIANGSPHLHLGLLLDGFTQQHSGSYLFDDECRQLLGGLRRGQRLASHR